ncbi:hypothetical protein F5Y06DRAFT_287090 [Hypoxylon sp. FL0890]|nr:hypothetical protein F5Y06DRAFT_287090 [Hypoxylon sp. FL0890]
MHDPHRQPPLPPSSAHPSFSSYPPRDPVVKRDPGEETSLPQLRRPNSTGNVVESLPPGAHGPHPNPPPPEDPRRHMSYDSGPSLPHSPAMYRPPQNYHPPPTPVAQHQYENPHVYGHPTQMYPLEIASSAKRKAQRASQACDSCRQLKAKCDETKPCKNCREKSIECKYRDPPAKQPDKVTADLIEMLTSMREELNTKLSNINAEIAGLRQDNLTQNHRVANLEAKVKQLNSGDDLKVESIEEEDRPDFPDSPIHAPKTQAEETLSSPGGTVVEPSVTLDEAHLTLQEANNDDVEEHPGPTVTPGKPAMPPNHTTLAGLLLKWPSIKRMVHHLMEAEKIFHPDEYPIRQEQQRGILRIFGRGEGFDQSIRASDKETPPDHGMGDLMDDGSDVASPSPMIEAWGQVGSLTPPPGVEYRGGVVNFDGNPDWDSTKIWRYAKSFEDNILNMHPIIIPRELHAMVTVFLGHLPVPKYDRPQGSKTGLNARFVNQSSGMAPVFSETGMKRKRSPAADEQTPSTTFVKPGRPFRSIDNAVVLLVLALGKICLHKDKIPEPVHESDSPMHQSPSVRNGVLASPLQGSPPGFLSQSSSMPSPKDSDRIPMSRRPSLQGIPASKGPHSYKRNLDMIPGLEYFALAMDIMSSHMGGFNLRHVYAHILVGLYYGQLGRVLESWSFISLASRNLQVILRPSLDRLSKWHESGRSIGQSRRDNQLAFAFWTCLQLESDILAELPLPHSNILQYEDRMPYPNSEYAVNHGFSEHVITGYIAQLYLRKQLNQVHTLLYDSDKQNKNKNGISLDDPAIEEGIKRIEEMLRNSKHRWVPSSYQWHEKDPPANDILGARLRAKYWGSQVILYRPFLRAILERESWLYPNQAGSPHNQNEDIPPNMDPRILNYATLAINALIESTRAFHGIPSNQRIIITNVFGTAHAQWGNLLTLAACYKDRYLSRFITADVLSNLFSRTISFFQSIVTPTSALKSDMNILIGLAKDLGFIRDEYDVASSSFSSITSGGPLPPMLNPSDNYHSLPPPSLGRPHLPPPHSIS